ncbi:hypothetical protein Fcan01_16003 [Folsomia candida]|uniref:Uncharacterized protein n=1 Tax=Folsomia candida TaxID=158441 RepID=A0A226DXQ3_FOLCA|nr:hypothetical protein Fcan01_16003 [Folsomia candida]
MVSTISKILFCISIYLLTYTATGFIHIFESCNLHFIRNNESLENDTFSVYFTILRIQNKYTPFFLHNIPANGTISDAQAYLSFTLSQVQRDTGVAKSSRITATFLTLNNHGPLSMKILQNLMAVIRLNYVLAHVNWILSGKHYYKYYNMVPAGSKLFLFSLTTAPPQIFLGSIISPESIQATWLGTIAQLDSMWSAMNEKNLHRSIVLMPDKLPANWTGECGPNLLSFQEIEFRPITEWICTLQVLGDKHNFTYAEARTLQVTKVNYMEFDVLLTQSKVDYLPKINGHIFYVDFEELKFAVVTNFPSKINSIFGVFTPFDGATWALILLSCLAMTLIIQFEGNIPRFTFLNMIGDFCLISSILFGQSIADKILRTMTNKKVSLPILTVWFFGSYLLMDNLYQGTIYSDLTVMYPQKVPETLETLAISNMSVLTTTFSRFPPLLINCFITRSLIPMLRKHKEIPDWLDDLQKRVIFIHPNNVDASLTEKILTYRQVATNKNETFSTTGSFAILDRTLELGRLTASLQMLGKRLVVESKSGNNLSFNTYVEGRRNLFTPIFHQGLLHLKQSGVFGRWEILRGMKEKLRFMRQHGETVYKRYFVKLNSNFQEPNIFHKCGDGDGMGALLYVLGLCVVLVGVGVVVLGLECWNQIEVRIKLVYRM